MFQFVLTANTNSYSKNESYVRMLRMLTRYRAGDSRRLPMRIHLVNAYWCEG